MEDKKIKELLVGLEENVEIENIDQYFQEQGVVVNVHVGRIRGNIELTPKTLGINLASKPVSDFFDNHVKNGSMSYIPLSLEKEMQKIENRIRMAKTRLSIGYYNSFMPTDTFKDFREQFMKAKEEYFSIRDYILDEWEQLKINFKKNLTLALSEMNPADQEKIFKAIMQKYPTKNEYASSFYMRLSIKAFPTMANISLLDEKLKEDVKESALQDNLKMVHEVLGICFNEIFQAANTVYKAYDKNRKLPNKTKGSLSNAIKSVKQKNLLKHPSVISLLNDMDTLYHTSDAEGIEIAESILARSYGEAADLGLVNYIDTRDCDLSQTDLEILYQAYAVA